MKNKKNVAILLTLTTVLFTACSTASKDLDDGSLVSVSSITSSEFETISEVAKLESQTTSEMSSTEEMIVEEPIEQNSSEAETIKSIVFADADVSENDVVIEVMVRYRSHQTYIHKIVFHTETNRYIYEVNADTKEITYSKSVPYHRSNQGKDNQVGNSGSEIISISDALDIAFDYASISKNDVKEQEIKIENDHGFTYYEIEIKTIFDVDYEFEIDAITGNVINFEID